MWTTHGLLMMYVVLIVSLTTMFVSLIGMHEFKQKDSLEVLKKKPGIPRWATKSTNTETFVYLTGLLKEHPKGGLEDMVRAPATNVPKTKPPQPPQPDVVEEKKDEKVLKPVNRPPVPPVVAAKETKVTTAKVTPQINQRVVTHQKQLPKLPAKETRPPVPTDSPKKSNPKDAKASTPTETEKVTPDTSALPSPPNSPPPAKEQ